ncbi:MAG TPA: hypothetical protein VHO70_18465 [Chitinispirillaceae bacterium]|nr:hypothetical protein [Chitinispirillaceae bacterium]
MKNQFTASTPEMDRRKTAFQSLCVSVVVSITVMGFILFSSHLMAVMVTVLVITLMLIPAAFYFNHLLDVSKQAQVTVREKEIEHIHAGIATRYPVASIAGIIVKRNVKGSIREIRFVTNTSGSFFINGLNDFENFFNCISAAVNKDVPVTTIREPIDFDHRMFYPILGTVVGVISALFLKAGLSLSIKSFAYLQIAIAVFSASFGMYWLISKPMVGRYGKKFILTDILAGIAMVATGVYLWFYSGSSAP